jgi:hypothetical protein
VALSLTRDEYKALQRAAAGRPVAVFIRALALAEVEPPPCAKRSLPE